MNLKQPYFDMVKKGVKTIELRLYDEKRQQIQIGDSILFQNENKHHLVKVKELVKAQNFDSLFKIIDIKKTGLGNKENALKIMNQFYPINKQNEIGVVGIVLED